AGPKRAPAANGSTATTLITVSRAKAGAATTARAHATTRTTIVMEHPSVDARVARAFFIVCVIRRILAHARERHIERGCKHAAHPVPVRTFPVNPIAAGAMHELAVMRAYAFRNAIEHGL